MVDDIAVKTRVLKTGASGERPPIVARPIFIVDDDPVSRLLTHACLTSLGLTNPRVELADGDEAMGALEACIVNPTNPLPVLVLLDLSMPGRSGIDVLRWMRKTTDLAHVPVIVLTSDDEVGSVTALYRLGVHSYLVKPVAFDALASVIRDLDLPWTLS